MERGQSVLTTAAILGNNRPISSFFIGIRTTFQSNEIGPNSHKVIKTKELKKQWKEHCSQISS